MSRGASASAAASSGALLVEFCGIPGAGKSHLASALVEGLGRRGIPALAGDATISPDVPAIRRIPRKLLAAGHEVLANPAGTVRAGLAIARAERSPGDAVARSMQWFVTQRALDRATRRGGVHVFQEGVLQALWSVGLRGDPEPLLEVLEAAGAAPWIRPHVLVVVNAPVEIAAARLGARRSSHSRTQDLSPDERTAELRRGRELLECLVEWWRACAGEGEIVEVANGSPSTDDGSSDRRLAPLVDRVVTLLERPAGRRGGIAIGP